MSAIEVVAFDLDGTLVDSLPGLHRSLNHALLDLEMNGVSQSQVRGWIGNGIDVLLTRALTSVNPAFSQSDHGILKQKFNVYYDVDMITGTVLYPGVKETLTWLADQGIRLALVTNKPSRFLPALLEDLGLSTFFDLVLGADDVKVKKPHPAPLFQLMAYFGLYRESLLFVGDSKNDIECAKHAGCKSIGLTYGYNYHEPIANAKPDYVFDDFVTIQSLFTV